jgi:hypothetical protein
MWWGTVGAVHRIVAPLALLAACTFVASGCVRHAIGPARTTTTYEHKAAATADAARGAVATVLLVADVATAGNAWKPYVDVALSEQEDALASAVDGFSSIQPPAPEADEIRAELLDLLGRAQDHVAAVRIEARRGHLDQLNDVATPLLEDQRALEDFMGENG